MSLHLEIYFFIGMLVVGLIVLYMYIKTPKLAPYVPQINAVVVWFDPVNNTDLCQYTPCYSPNVSFGADLDFVYFYRNIIPNTTQVVGDKIFFDTDAYQKILATDFEYKNDSGEDVIVAISGQVLDPEPVKSGSTKKGKVKGNVSFHIKELLNPSNGVIKDGTTLSVTFTFVKA